MEAVKRSARLITALSSAAILLSASANCQTNSSAKDPNAEICGVDTTHPPTKSFARGFSGSWRPVADDERSADTWGQTAALWPRQGGGTFVQLWMLDEPSSASWSERVDYCFGADGCVAWIDARYNRLESDSRIDRFEFNALGTVTKHGAQCLKPVTEETYPADEQCKDSNAFPMIKRIGDFPFFRKTVTEGH